MAKEREPMVSFRLPLKLLKDFLEDASLNNQSSSEWLRKAVILKLGNRKAS